MVGKAPRCVPKVWDTTTRVPRRSAVTDRRYSSAVGEREPDGEGRADVGCTVDLDRTVVIFHDLLRDVEAKTRTALALFGREVGIEDLAHLRVSNAVAG